LITATIRYLLSIPHHQLAINSLKEGVNEINGQIIREKLEQISTYLGNSKEGANDLKVKAQPKAGFGG
jgi:hypothetical protein